MNKEQKNCYIIAEAGVNHNGSLDLAKQLIDAAADAGADAVKFQTFKADKLVTASAKKAEYQEDTCGAHEGQYEMLKRLELDWSMHEILLNYAKSRGIQFLSTAFDLESLADLNDLGLPLFKVPSGEITNYPMLVATATLGKPIILSTGMANLGDIEKALHVLVSHGVEISNITALHCTTAYPTPEDEVNLKAMLTIGAAFPGVQIGYSDHTLGIDVSLAAVAMGARVIEKHITLDKGMEGPDHRASLEPDELKQMVASIRIIERALGSPCKRRTKSEEKNMKAARKSIVASMAISKGEILSEVNLTVKRPGGGVSPMGWPEVVGKLAIRDFEPDEMISL